MITAQVVLGIPILRNVLVVLCGVFIAHAELGMHSLQNEVTVAPGAHGVLVVLKFKHRTLRY